MNGSTAIGIEGRDFFFNGRPSYAGRVHQGRRIEGILLNSRMIQGIFDDENPETARRWAYPDTGRWDAERNTREFCAMLPVYRACGLLGVTVGLQGGGPAYMPEVYDHYRCSAFHSDGSLKPAFMARLERVLAAADACGMAVIVNYFYWRQERFDGDKAVLRAAREATEWLLATGRRHVLVDVKNEIREGGGLLESGGIHRVLDQVRQTTLDGRRLPVGTSTFPTNHFPRGQWAPLCDFLMPHTNDSVPDAMRAEMRQIKAWEAENKKCRPVLINEDSPDLASLEAAIDEGVSWGYFDQGYGCGYRHAKWDWSDRGREPSLEELSGFQTPPVNWGIQTAHKRAFFMRIAAITGNSPPPELAR